jgi:hypothetical protein
MELSDQFVLGAFGVALAAAIARDWLGSRRADPDADPRAHHSASQGASGSQPQGGGDGPGAGGGDGCGPGDAC